MAVLMMHELWQARAPQAFGQPDELHRDRARARNARTDRAQQHIAHAAFAASPQQVRL